MKCPCKGCISYAICNARLKGMDNPDVVKLAFRAGCVNLRSYVQGGHGMANIRTTRLLYGLSPYKPTIR